LNVGNERECMTMVKTELTDAVVSLNSEYRSKSDDVLTVNRNLDMVEQIVTADAFLSDSGKGIKEYEGRVESVRRSVRGVTLLLNTGKQVCWKLSNVAADMLCDSLTGVGMVVVR